VQISDVYRDGALRPHGQVISKQTELHVRVDGFYRLRGKTDRMRMSGHGT
jgi:hypothetical protein